MNNMQLRLEKTMLQTVMDYQDFLDKHGVGYNVVYDPDRNSQPALNELVVGALVLSVLVEMIKEEEGKERLCGGKRQ